MGGTSLLAIFDPPHLSNCLPVAKNKGDESNLGSRFFYPRRCGFDGSHSGDLVKTQICTFHMLESLLWYSQTQALNQIFETEYIGLSQHVSVNRQETP